MIFQNSMGPKNQGMMFLVVPSKDAFILKSSSMTSFWGKTKYLACIQ